MAWEPAKFDAFDSSKIGSGEGAQAYGHGLYLAESPGVAKSYKQMSTPADFEKAVDAIWPVLRKGSIFSDDAIAWGPLQSKVTKEQFRKIYENNPDATWAQLSPALRSNVEKALSGHLYKVDLPDEQIAKMLDWDKPLSQQPEVLEALKKSKSPIVRKTIESLSDVSKNRELYGNDLGPSTGESLHRLLALNFEGRTSNSPKASEALRKAGIPGIKYLDAGSRGAGEGTRNFVVFPGNEGILSILERQ